MSGVIAAVVLVAAAALVVWMARLGMAAYRNSMASDDVLGAAVSENIRARSGALLVCVPALVLVLLDAASWVIVGYLIAAVLVLGAVLLRRRVRR